MKGKKDPVKRGTSQGEPPILKETNFTDLGEKHAGKVRDIYTQNKRLILISTDRHSSFDRNIAHIPFKGAVLTQISNWWFDETQDIVPNHVIATPDSRAVVVERCKVIPVEAVFRGFITGTTSTSLWTHYKDGQRDFGDFTLPDDMVKNQRLKKPVFTPSTKDDEHDETLTPKEMIERGIVTEEMLRKVENIGFKLFERGQELAAKKGLILVDTKYEFGLDENGDIMLIDEIHTPDSSRYWYTDSYEERFARGEEPRYFDKEFLRLWFRDNCDPYKDDVLPEAPAEMVAELSRRYIAIHDLLTGNTFESTIEGSVEDRLAKNLEAYKI